MIIRRVLWAVIVVSALMMVVAGVTAGWLLLRPRSSSMALLVADSGSELRLLPDGQATEVISTNHKPAQYRFPAVSPGGRQIAYVGADGDKLAVFVQQLPANERKRVFISAVDQPFDLGWSPDGRYLVFLVPGQAGFLCMIVPADGSAEAQAIAAGPTIYYSWSEDSSQIAIHVGGHAAQNGRVELYRPGESQAMPLLSDPSFFQAPMFSRDGQSLFYAAQPPIANARPTFADISANIVRVGVDGKNPQTLAKEPQAVLRVVRAPTSDMIAYGIQHLAIDGSFVWGELKLIDEHGTVRTLSRSDEHVSSFFWSPDGQQIAYLAFRGNEGPSGMRTWSVVTVADGNVRELATFQPSQAFIELNQYFEAYAFGYTPWSPDSNRLAYAAEDGIYVVDWHTGKANRVGDGAIALWIGDSRGTS